jgi:hypothetical protein
MPSYSVPLRRAPAFVPALLAALACAACDQAPRPDEGGTPAPVRAAVLEPFLEVEVDERWRGISAYNARDTGDQVQPDEPLADGPRTLWHDNGVKRGEGAYLDGKRQGPWTYWYESGQKRWEGTFEADRSEGLERSWFENGQREYEGTFHDEVRDGRWQRWYDNGRPAVFGHYRQGERQGEFRYWGYDGQLDRERSGVYADDVKVGELAGG